MGGWSLLQVTTALAIFFAVLAVIVVPLAKKRLSTVNDSGKPKWAVIVLILETTQLMALAALISAVATYTVLWFLTRGTGTSATSVAHAIERIEQIEQWLGTARLTIWLWVFVLAVLGLCYWIARRRTTQFERARAALMQEKFNYLVNEFNEGHLPPLEPTPAMQELIARAEELDAASAEVEQRIETAESDDDRAGLTELKANLEAERQATVERLITTDLLRRIDIPPHDPDLIGLPPAPRSFLQKVGRIFISRGVFRHLALGQRVLLVASLLLLIPVLLNLTGTAISADLQARLTNLDALRVELNAQETEARLEAAASLAAAPADETVEEDDVDDDTFSDVAHAHAHVFETNIARNLGVRYLPHESTRVAAASNDARSVVHRHQARQRILAATAKRINAQTSVGSAGVPGGRAVEVRGANVNALTLVDTPDRPIPLSELVDQPPSNGHKPKPRALTPAGKSLAQDIITRGKTDRGFRKLIVTSFRKRGASFFEVARLTQLRGIVLTSALGGAVDAVPLDDVLGKPVANWAAEVIDPAVRARTYQAYSRAYLTSLYETGNVQQALAAVENLPDHHLTRREISVARTEVAAKIKSNIDLVGEVERSPPGLVEARDGKTDVAARDRALRRYYTAEAGRRNITLTSERLANFVRSAPASASYEVHFPSDIGSLPQANTAEGGRGVRGGRGGGGVGTGGGGVRAGGARTASAGSAVARSRSFIRMRGFARVGGVVIGREAEEGQLNLKDLRWKTAGRDTTLFLVDDKNEEIKLGPFPTTIVNLALAYAADGRVLTVTMTTAEPLSELRILLHPVLVDTALGCHTIELDRFVDMAVPTQEPKTEKLTQRGFQTQLIYIQQGLYAAARTSLIEALLDPASRKLRNALGADYDQFAEILRNSVRKEERFAKDLDALARVPSQLLSDPDVSPLVAKQGYFHPSLARIVTSCARSDGNGAALRSCLDAEGAKLVTTINLNSVRDMNLIAPTPTFQIWSGVRERPYNLDPMFKFAGVDHGKAPEPFDFIIQVAFTSPPYAALAEPWFSIEEGYEPDDNNPWLFPDEASEITAKVVAAIQEDPKMAETFEVLREFVWLERLFRAGLAGRLGPNFPVERLALLAEQTQAQVSSQRTLRWNVRAYQEERAALYEIASIVPVLEGKARTRAERCLKTAGIDPQQVQSDEGRLQLAVTRAVPKIRSLSDDEWDDACGDQVAPTHLKSGRLSRTLGHERSGALLSELKERLARISELRRLRTALGIHGDEALAFSDVGCKQLH